MAKNFDNTDPIVALTLTDKLLVGQIDKDRKAKVSDVVALIEEQDLVLTGAVVVNNIEPSVDGVYNLGTETKRFNSVYANEVFVGAHSLYVNGKKVIEDNSDVMTFLTDEDQAINIKTQSSVDGSGNGNLSLSSDNEINMIAKGGMEYTVSGVASKNIVFTNESVGGNIQFVGEVIANGDLNITGDLIVSGTTTTIDTQTLLIEDNVITINKNQTGTPVSTLVSGIEVERGDELNYRFIFDELTDSFKVGEQGSEQSVATRENTPIEDALAVWNSTANQLTTSGDLIFDGSDLTILNKRVVTASQGTTLPSSPRFADEFYNTDLDKWYKFNGAVWMQI